MNRFRKALCVALVLLLLVASVPAVPVADLGFGITASALNATGKCGKTATYTFDSATGKLTIEGTGKINAEAFYQNKDIKSVVIGDGITEIGADAFYGCSNLTTLDLGNTVTVIGDNAFGGCNSLTGVEIPDSVITIDNGAFQGCDKLMSVDIGDNVKIIGNYIFYDCDNLASIVIGDAVTTIGNEAFYDCDNLTSVVIGNGVTTIYDFAFAYCDNLTSVTVGNSVESIYRYAFYNCTSLESINIPKTVTSIGNDAFRYCPSLYDVYYEGSEAEWNAISIGANNTALENATIHFGSVSEPSIPSEPAVCEHDVVTVAYKNSTCTEFGNKRYYKCTKCGIIANDSEMTLILEEVPVIALKAHTWIDATCTNPKVCSVCDTTEGTPVPHNVDGVEFTKYNDEYHSKKCAVCGTDVAMAKHSFGDFVVTTPPTCTDKGEKKSTCEACGATKKSEVAATGHNWQNGKCKVCKISCTHEEWNGNVCKNCGFTCSNHEYDDATCKKAAICKICGAEVNPINPANHETTEVVVKNAKEAKCYEPGYTGDKYYACCDTLKQVGKTITVEHVYATTLSKVSATKHGYVCTNYGCTAYYAVADHEFEVYEVQVPPTCFAEGKAIFKCNDCGALKVDTLDVLDHDTTGAAFEKADYYSHGKRCVNCGEFVEKEYHAYTETVSMTLPTCVTEGAETKKCVCGDTRTFKLEKNDNHDWGAWEYVYAPTCTTAGSKARCCKRVGCTAKDVVAIEATGHDLVKVPAVAATCQNAGNNKYYDCTKCNMVFKDAAGTTATTVVAETIAKGEHNFAKYVYNVNSETCTKEGTETAKCANGGCDATHTRDKVGTMVAHTFKNYVSDGNATCIVDGTKSAVCEMCKEAKDIVADKDSHKVAPHKPDPTGRKCELCGAELVCTHTYSIEKLITKTPTCTTDGQKAIVCSKCHANKPGSEEVVPRTGHAWGEGVITKTATCKENGTMRYTCNNMCGETKTEEIPVKPHNYKEVITHATCTETGYSTFTCTLCGSHYVDKPVEAYGHMFETYFYDEGTATCYMDGTKTSTCANGCGTTNTVVDPGSKTDHEMLDFGTIKDPTCTEEGEEEAMCFYYDKCGYSEIVPIDPLGHNYITSEDENGNITYYCTVCGDTNDNSTPDTGDHTYPDQWSVIIPATCKETGVAIKICFDCNEIITMIVPKTGHKDINRDKKCDSCGKTIGVVDSDEPDIPEKPEEKPCNCDCHAGGIKAFFFKLINFFVKIFDKNARVCDCGKAH